MYGPFLRERVMGLESGSSEDASDGDEWEDDLVHEMSDEGKYGYTKCKPRESTLLL